MKTPPVNRRARIAGFVRGYFAWLETAGVRAALLHGGEDGFESEISDVDHVVEPAGFVRIAELVHQYCTANGWRLCQVLRHEDTAAFCVCSALDDTACVVALDACSDYRRNGQSFICSEDLLENRQPQDNFGYRLAPAMELRYRFIKAAAKAKRSGDVIPGMLAMDDSARVGFREWLHDSWNVGLVDWTPSSMAAAMADLTKQCGPQKDRFRLSEVPRLTRRIMHPDGLLVLLSTGDEERVKALSHGFSGLYFRRHAMVRKAGIKQRMDLIRSTLVIAGSTRPGTLMGLDRDCVISLPTSEAMDDSLDRIATHLNQRCLKRTGLREFQM
jgi:hypothetical protein